MSTKDIFWSSWKADVFEPFFTAATPDKYLWGISVGYCGFLLQTQTMKNRNTKKSKTENGTLGVFFTQWCIHFFGTKVLTITVCLCDVLTFVWSFLYSCRFLMEPQSKCFLRKLILLWARREVWRVRVERENTELKLKIIVLWNIYVKMTRLVQLSCLCTNYWIRARRELAWLGSV